MRSVVVITMKAIMPNLSPHFGQKRRYVLHQRVALSIIATWFIPTTTAFSPTLFARHTVSVPTSFSSKLASSLTTPAQSTVGNRISIDEDYPGLKRIHANPDIFVIEQFLDDASCDDLINKALDKGTHRSPVAYAGWSDDIKDLLGLAASGPVSWFAILGAWYESQGDTNASVPSLVIHALRNYAGLFIVAAIGIAIFTKWRADSLQNLRTSTSTTLDDLSQIGPQNFVKRASDLFEPASESLNVSPAAFFEAPTVIRYEKDQALAPHFDANRSAEFEDKNRGGQTLSTLLVYLNDVDDGGTTRFGRLPQVDDQRQVKGDKNLNIIPKKGDALLFFPADKNGIFDERTEHEGCPAVDQKWVARIWRHADRVPPPFGLSDDSIEAHL